MSNPMVMSDSPEAAQYRTNLMGTRISTGIL